MRSVLALAMWSSLLSLPAWADPAPARPAPRAIDAPRMPTDDCARARAAGKTCELTLSPEEVGGATPGPDDIALRLLAFGRAGSLLSVRHDFVHEIVLSAEDL